MTDAQRDDVPRVFYELTNAHNAERAVRVRTRSGDVHVGFVSDVTLNPNQAALVLVYGYGKEVTLALDDIESVSLTE